METNSKVYWDHRFDTDWEERMGREQSAFFAKIALGAFPQWFVAEVQQKKLSICDWGCALGDGTAAVKAAFPDSDITGIDFSTAAIDKAGETYPGIRFISRDLLSARHEHTYDVFFSSNTLEHFDKPWDVLLQLRGYAMKHLAVLIPYKERDRHEEHLYTFDETNIRSKLGEDLYLTHMEIIDGASFSPNYWGQLQVLLIYSTGSEIRALQLKTISDTDIRVAQSLYEQNALARLVKDMQERFREQLRLLESAHQQEAELHRQSVERYRQEAELHLQDAEEQRQAAEVYRQERDQANASLELTVAALTDAQKLQESNLQMGRRLAEQDSLVENLKKELGEALVELKVLGTAKEQLKEKEKLVEDLSRKLEKATVQGGIRNLLEEQLKEKELLIHNLKAGLDASVQSENDLRLQLNHLNEYVGKLQRDINWYKATFEDRSILGVLRDKMSKPRRK